MTITNRKTYSKAFTITEMLIVIVVIGIIATLTILAYRGIQHNANVAVLKSDLKQADTQLGLERVDTDFPEDVSEMNNGQGLKFTNSNVTYYYTVHNESTPADYCITAILDGESYKMTRGATPSPGYCTDQLPNGPLPVASADSETQISVSWDPVDNVDTYRLEYSQSSDFSASTSIDDITETSQTVEELQNSQTYYFRVYASNILGEGAASDYAYATTNDPPPPGAPVIALTTNSSTQITVNWSAIDGTDHYRLHYGTTNALTATPIDNLTGTSTSVSGLSQGTRYYFGLYAVSAGGDSLLSNVPNAITTINTPDSPAVSASIPGSARAWNSGVWAKAYDGDPTSGTWYYAQATISSSTCASGTTRQWRARIQYNSPTTWGAWTGWTTTSTIYSIGPNSGYGIRYQAQTRCYTSVATSASSASAYGCRWKSNNSTTCSGF